MPSEDKYTAQLVSITDEINQANMKKFEEDHAKWKADVEKVITAPFPSRQEHHSSKRPVV
jgi:hypothetical protein